jgi:hypothetical protein
MSSDSGHTEARLRVRLDEKPRIQTQEGNETSRHGDLSIIEVEKMREMDIG